MITRLRERHRWLDHLFRAAVRYDDAKGDFYAAAITYFTIFALFPLLMLGFAVGGIVLASRPELLASIEERIRSSVTGELSQQLVQLMDSAIASRTSVGIIGIGTAVWAGLGWVDKLREALSQMWEQRGEKLGYLHKKRSDLMAMVSAFVAILLSIALTAVAEAPALGDALQVVSRLLSWLVTWLLFTWMIARMPRESVSLHSSARAGLLAAAGFELFKLVGTIYLRAVVHGPAGATFGPVLGLMVFAYITARLVLFSTAWAATVESAAVEVAAAG